MKAIVLKDISPLIKKDAVLIKRGKWAILEGHDKRQYVPTEEYGVKYKTPNFYPWVQIQDMKRFYKIDK